MSETGTITMRIDDIPVRVAEGSTIWEAAREAGIDIPVLCHEPGMTPLGVCRLCVVDVGQRTYAASCVRLCEEGLQVRTRGPELEAHRRMLTSLLLADYPAQSAREESTGDDQLLALARRINAKPLFFPAAQERKGDDSSPVIAVSHQACILCDRCIRACDEIQHNHVIGRTGKGYGTRIAFDLDQPMGKSSCVACGECMASCPTGALTNKSLAGLRIRVIE